ncbi:MAG: type I-C CRISPR-associated protein Cas5c [Spirochaetaceae bacterium]|nr:type I-C CRISPR-associated protein Cas5c [Spirochaetaceae bacterium]
MKNWCIEVWGDYACFTRPEMKVERVSYDVITPSAARGLYEAILWKPAIVWHITKIEVLNKIKWVSVRRNEVGTIANERSDGIYIEDVRQQRAGLFLRDVCYRIHAWFEYIPPEKRLKCEKYGTLWADCEEESQSRDDESEAKYAAMFERRAKKGQCFHRPYLGCREFACGFRLVHGADKKQPIADSLDLGWILYDMDFSVPEKPKPEFFRACLENGVLNVDRRQIEVRS